MARNKGILILASILLLIFSGCSNEITGRAVLSEPETFDIGVIAPLTGSAASYGLAAKEGLDYAVKEINLEGGVLGKKIRLHYEDSQLDNKQAVSIMNKFINLDKYSVIIVADGSGPTMAVAPLADQTQTLILATLASTPQLSEMGDYVFRTVPSDAYQGYEMARFAEKKRFESAAILYVNDAYGRGIRDVFAKEYTGKIVSSEAFDHDDADFRTQLVKIKSKEPELIVVVARKELPNILIQTKNLGMTSTLLGSETTKDDDSIKAAGQASEGLYSVFFAEQADHKEFRKKYEAEHGRSPHAFSGYSYDAVYALHHAITFADSFNPEEIKYQLYNLKFRGATGIVEFDSNGDVTNKPFTFYKVVNGEFIPTD